LAVAAAGLAFFALRDPGIAADSADGSYANDCCGTLVLRDGHMVLGETRSVDYELGEDAEGPFVLPETYVGTWEELGFEVDGSRPPVKLRLDALPKPRRIEVPAATGWRSFERKAPRPLKTGSRPDTAR
jgi:hypothetical protein